MIRKPCPVCGKHIVGRSDKKFCSAGCKNKFHHPSQYTKGDIIKTVNQFLFQNFKIMESVFKEEKKDKMMVPRILLDKMGFHFNYCTGCYINNQGKLYRYIYDYAWMEFSTQELMLVRKKEN
jgi:predicted nucleic acid-binding Zn ribbon protein